VIRPEDVLLLEYIYSDKSESAFLTSWFRIIASQYGAAIPSACLRHATLAYAAALLQLGERVDHHKEQVLHSLIKTLGTPDTIRDADLFAAFLLSFVVWGTQGRASKLFVHANGCMSMMLFLAKNSKQKPLTDIFMLLRPFLLSYLNRWNLFTGGELTLPTQRTRFRERLRYLGEFRRVGLPEAWTATNNAEAIHDTLADLIDISMYCLLQIAESNALEGETRASVVADIIELIDAELADPDCQRALEAMSQALPPSGRTFGSFEAKIAGWQFQRLRTVQLARNVLRAPSILQGFECPETMSIASILITTFRSEFSSWESWREYYGHSYEHCLLLAGLGIPKANILERTLSG
jgi:hypothetical protein